MWSYAGWLARANLRVSPAIEDEKSCNYSVGTYYQMFVNKVNVNTSLIKVLFSFYGDNNTVSSFSYPFRNKKQALRDEKLKKQILTWMIDLTIYCMKW